MRNSLLIVLLLASVLIGSIPLPSMGEQPLLPPPPEGLYPATLDLASANYRDTPKPWERFQRQAALEANAWILTKHRAREILDRLHTQSAAGDRVEQASFTLEDLKRIQRVAEVQSSIWSGLAISAGRSTYDPPMRGGDPSGEMTMTIAASLARDFPWLRVWLVTRDGSRAYRVPVDNDPNDLETYRDEFKAWLAHTTETYPPFIAID